jgi:UrcA family protein
MKKSIKALSVALVSMGVLAVPALSQAATPDTAQRTVRYSDLDLTTLDGNAALYRRLRTAAVRVCQADSDLPPLGGRRCARSALDNAVNSVNSPMLTLINGGYEPAFIVVTAREPVVSVYEIVVRR